MKISDYKFWFDIFNKEEKVTKVLSFKEETARLFQLSSPIEDHDGEIK